MLRKFFLPIPIIVFFVIPAHSQNNLLRQIQLTKDNNAIKNYLEYAVTLNGSDNKMALELYKAIIVKSEELHFNYGIGEGWVNIGLLDMWSGECEQSMIAAKKALYFFRKINNKPKIGYCYFIMGKSCSYLGHSDSCMNYLLEGLKYIESQPCKEQAYLYNLIGRIIFYSYFTSPGQINKVLDYHLKGLQISKTFNDTSQLIYGSIYLADDYMELKRSEEAHRYFKYALELAEANKNPHDLAEVYNEACHKYFSMNKFDSSVLYGKQALKYSLLSDDNNNYIQSSINLARSYDAKNDQENRLMVLRKGLKVLNDQKNNIKKYDFYIDYTDALYKTHKYKEAYEYHSKNLTEAIDQNIFKMSLRASELEVKYQTSLKEKKLIEQRLELAKKDLLIQKNRSYIFYSLLGLSLLLFLLASFYFRHLRKRREYNNQMQALEQQKKIQILQALMQGEEKERSRIAKDLHDGVAGVLVAVKMHLNALRDSEKNTFACSEVDHIISLVDDTYNEIRKTSHNLMPEVLVRYGLDEALKIYCHNISNSNKLVIQYDSWGEFTRYKNSFELSVYRIVQELIANIIKHSKASKALVQMSLLDTILSIDIEDNGIGFSNNNDTKGMGLHTIQSKVKAIDGRIELVSGINKGACAYMEFDISHMKVNQQHE